MTALRCIAMYLTKSRKEKKGVDDEKIDIPYLYIKAIVSKFIFYA